jgi:hypothetical protein
MSDIENLDVENTTAPAPRAAMSPQRAKRAAHRMIADMLGEALASDEFDFSEYGDSEVQEAIRAQVQNLITGHMNRSV